MLPKHSLYTAYGQCASKIDVLNIEHFVSITLLQERTQ
jgi:hypothetical protein